MNKSGAKARSKVTKRRPAPKKARPVVRTQDLSFSLDPRREGLDEIFGAAYLMIDRAYVLVEGDPTKSLTVTLRPKAERTAAARAALSADFRAELAAQRVRWAIARSNQPIREYVSENALALAQEFAARPAAGAAAPAETPLTVDQRAEIERLIADVENEIKSMNEQKTQPDPKGMAAPWEAGRPQAGGGETPS